MVEVLVEVECICRTMPHLNHHHPHHPHLEHLCSCCNPAADECTEPLPPSIIIIISKTITRNRLQALADDADVGDDGR